MINISFIVNEHYANDLLNSVHSKRSRNLSEMVKYMKIYSTYFFLEISHSHYHTLSKVGSKFVPKTPVERWTEGKPST